MVEEGTENVEEAKITEMALFELGNKCLCSYTICGVLAVIVLAISIEISAYFAYKYMNRNKENVSRYEYVYQGTNYYYKWEISNKVTLKIERITFLMTWSILKTLIQAY